MSPSSALTGCVAHRPWPPVAVRSARARRRVPRGLWCACALLSLLLCAAPAARATPDAPAESRGREAPAAALELPEVEILSDPLEGSRRARAAQSSAIDAARFAAEGRTVAEMLGTAPGVALHASGGPLQATTLSLRGASPEQSLVLLDGIPLQGPGGGAIDLATLPATLLSRMVVSRGVLGAQLGAGALGGAVELVPRSAGPAGAEGGVQLSYGSFATAQLAADLSTRTEAAGAFTAALQLDKSSGDFDYARQFTPELAGAPWYAARRENADGQRGALLLRWEGHPAGLKLDLLAHASAGERGLPGPVGAFTTHARAADQSGLLGARLAGTAGDAVWSLRLWGRGDRVQVDGLSHAFSDCVPGTAGCDPTESHTVGSRAEAEVGTPLGAGQWLTVSAAGGEEWVVGSASGRHRRTVAWAAAADDLKLWGERLELHPALRLDRVGEETALSPGLALAFRPLASERGLVVRASVGRSFRAPSFAELYVDQGALAPNPELRPERATSADLGVGLTTERASVSVAAFATWTDDLVVYELFPPARIKPFNAGAARVLGAEVQGAVKLPLGLTASLAYSLLDARSATDSLTEGGQRLPYRPPHRLFLRLAHQGDRLEGFAELVATSETPRNAYGTAALRAQAALNAGLFVRTFGPVWAGLELRNALDDRTRQDLFQYPLPGASFTALVRARL